SLYSESNNINDLKESLKCYDLTVKLIEKVRDYLSKESKYTLTENVKNTFDNAIKISLELYKTKKDKKYLETAFEYAEKSKSAVLLASIRDVDAIKFSGIPETLQKIEKEINGKIRAYDKLVYDEKNSENPNSDKINLWGSKLFDLNREYDSLISKFEKEHKQYYSLKYDKNVISVKTIQKKLNKNKALIEYTVSDSLLFIFVITSEKFSAFELPIDSTFFRNIEELRKLLKNVSAENSNVNFRDYSIVSYQLYRDLIKPIQNLITGKDLIIIPDGILGYIPFEALISMLPDVEKIDYRNLFYLIKNYPISYSYSATLLFKDYKTKTTGNKLLAFAPAYEITDKTEKNQSLVLNKFSDILIPIKNAKNEINNINKIFDGKFLQDLDATELNFKTFANNFDVLHFAMHTIIDDENPMYSKMVFTLDNDSVEDGCLNTYEIYNLDLNARLAVLSACNTGFGKLSKGEGIMSLARGFLYSGVQSIIMTLWKIEDKSGVEIMTKFYTNLKKGNSIDNALRKAKLDYLKSASQFRAHPYFWAAYVDIGNTSPLCKSTGINPILLSVCVLIIIVILSVWIYRKKYLSK
ncbi:MAG: CHAT domain-containing protein, partial [Bacteroidales bacterium]|nr:CHAT domain-containing protein [Bacteroidales bacterium]